MLETFPLQDDQPAIEGASTMVAYTPVSVDYIDQKAYANERFEFLTEEVQLISQLVPVLFVFGELTFFLLASVLQEKNLQAGDGILSIMYSYRSVSRAISKVFCTRIRFLFLTERVSDDVGREQQGRGLGEALRGAPARDRQDEAALCLPGKGRADHL